MPVATPLVRVRYMNVSGSDVPPHGIVQMVGAPIQTATGDYVFQVTTPGGGNGPYMIDDGKGTSSTGAGQYGGCYRAFEGAVWAAYSAGTNPLPAPWGPVGPKAGLFSVTGDGDGYYYAGQYDAANSRILVTLGVMKSGFHQGTATTSTASFTNGWTGPVTIMATEYVPDPTSMTTPRRFIAGQTGIKVVIRDESLKSVSALSYIEWQTITLPDGSTENELTYVQVGEGGFHQGIVTSSTDTSLDNWIRPLVITATEYGPDPQATAATPWPFIEIESQVLVVVRDKITVPNGAFIEWQEVPLPNGSVENELTWISPTPPITFHQGVVTEAQSSETIDSWIRPTTLIATEFVPNPGAPGFPWPFVPGPQNVSVVVRPTLLVKLGATIQWITITMPDGTTENQLIAGGSSAVSLHQGVVAADYSKDDFFDPWSNAGLLQVVEYVDSGFTTSNSTSTNLVPGPAGQIVVRSSISTIKAGTYVQWWDFVKLDGTTEGTLVTGPVAGGGSFHQGKTTVAYTKSRVWDGQANAGVVTCTEWIDDPTDGGFPRKFIDGDTGLQIVVRSNVSSITVGTMIQWQDAVLSDGTIEPTYAGGDCKP